MPSVHPMPPDRSRGRVLRLKQGYNPNSSSIGTIVFVMPAALLVATVAFGVAASLICSAFAGGRSTGGEGTDGEENRSL